MKRLWLLLILAWAAGPADRADVKPHGLFSDGMVLQQGMKCPVCGTADPGEEVALTLTEGDKELTKVRARPADQEGNWQLTLPSALKAGGPYTLILQGKNTVTIKDVLVGE